MYDMTKKTAITWDVKFVDGQTLKIKPPTVRNMTKIINLASEAENDYSLAAEIVSTVLSSNVENIAISKDTVMDSLTAVEMNDFCNSFYDWINNEVNAKNS